MMSLVKRGSDLSTCAALCRNVRHQCLRLLQARIVLFSFLSSLSRTQERSVLPTMTSHRQSIYDRLPEDLQQHIDGLLLQDNHLLARLLLRHHHRRTGSLCDAIGVWRAVDQLNVADHVIQRSARCDHDMWYQQCEWDLGENATNVFGLFHVLERVLHRIIVRTPSVLLPTNHRVYSTPRSCNAETQLQNVLREGSFVL